MTTQGSSPTHRLGYIDWMRGLAILIMIEAHVLDAWTRPTERYSIPFGCAAVLAGFAAPMFLFLAGLSVVLAASSGLRKTGDPARAAARVRRRGWEVFGLAYLFRFQAYMLHPKAMLAGLLNVDILNIMGPSIVAAAALWQVARTNRRRIIVLGSAALAMTLVTPLIRTTPLVDLLPAPVQWYIRPTPGRNNFTFFPWAGFAFAGAMIGVLLDKRREAAEEKRLHVRLGLGGLGFAAACYAGSYLPSIYPDSHFWTSSPMFFLLRVGVVTAVLGAVYFWNRRPTPLADRLGWHRSPITEFGRSSLFIYWVHVELVYGVVSEHLHKNLSFQSVWVAFAVLSLMMLALALIKDLVVARVKAWRAAGAQAPPSMMEKA